MSDYQIERTESGQCEDTQPIEIETYPSTPERWRKVAGFVCLIIATGLTLATVLILLFPPRTDVKLEIPPLESTPAVVAEIPAIEQQEEIFPESALPTLSPEEAQTLLSTHMIQVADPNSIETVRDI